MRIIELIIDEERIQDGVEAISIVDRPAIRQNFITLSEQEKVKLAEVDNERRVLMGAVLIPNQIIPRIDEATGEEYCVFFSSETIRTASELYFKRENQANSTYEHQEEKLEGTCIVESWIIEDDVHDKSRKFGLSHPVGTWMVAKKIYSDSVWNEYVETGLVKGFSIEGFFSEGLNSYELSEQNLKSYTDYPESIKNNAKRVLKWVEENGWGSCGTNVGKQRANQLANGEAISLDTVKRMYSYLSRHAPDLDASKSYDDGCGKLMYDAWGGRTALSWSKSIVERESKMEGLSEDEADYVLSKVERMISDKLNELNS